MQKHIAHDEGYKYLPLEDPKDYFFTFSFDLSVFLICKEYELETIDNHEDKRLVFIFKKDDRDILDTVEEYWSNKIAQFVYQKYISQEIAKKPVVVILKGDLGAGKTIFVKGIAEHLHVNNVISPTFTIYYEYRVKKAAVSILYHYDLYTVEDAEELTHLGIDDNLKPGNLLFFEWGEKSGDIFEKFKQKAKVFFIEILYENKDIRNLQIKSL
jgi:tRNA threonylcarbamoyladenosine biosynthesis protein TsaE